MISMSYGCLFLEHHTIFLPKCEILPIIETYIDSGEERSSSGIATLNHYKPYMPGKTTMEINTNTCMMMKGMTPL
jgi:hypothetical protein